MLLKDRIEALVYLGKQLRIQSDRLDAEIERSFMGNRWFTRENSKEAVQLITDNFLDESKLLDWVLKYKLIEQDHPKRIGLILNGNTPVEGIHDMVSIFIKGHFAFIKLAETDQYFLPFFVEILKEGFPEVEPYFHFMERLNDIDAAILTINNQQGNRYYETYFSKFPNIIRKSRNSVAILNGEETTEELNSLSHDLLQFFGLGHWAVSKIYIPKNYNFDPLLEAIHHYKEIIHHNKYKNNFDYNYTLYILNKVEHHSTGCMLLIENASVKSRIASLHFEYYESAEDLKESIEGSLEDIQRILAAKPANAPLPSKPIGISKYRGLEDFENEVDVIEFLSECFK